MSGVAAHRGSSVRAPPLAAVSGRSSRSASSREPRLSATRTICRSDSRHYGGTLIPAADGPALVFSADGWSSFVTALKSGRLSA
ncbi:DUF397 domain-containing protein [Streptomyces sp. McG3]|uniref:DUF397 domain-containing protein n=1 Tax=Streptomyces sp. McG3 TaxID=2725483 RepID=UPI00203755F5|nr:DUF397 domain-containing protein [Streptomyces sp. McG3]